MSHPHLSINSNYSNRLTANSFRIAKVCFFFLTGSHSMHSLPLFSITALCKDIFLNCTFPLIFLLKGNREKFIYFHSSFYVNIFSSLLFYQQAHLSRTLKNVMVWKAIMNPFVNVCVNRFSFIHFSSMFFVLFIRHTFLQMNVLHLKLGLSLTSILIWMFFWIFFFGTWIHYKVKIEVSFLLVLKNIK